MDITKKSQKDARVYATEIEFNKRNRQISSNFWLFSVLFHQLHWSIIAKKITPKIFCQNARCKQIIFCNLWKKIQTDSNRHTAVLKMKGIKQCERQISDADNQLLLRINEIRRICVSNQRFHNRLTLLRRFKGRDHPFKMSANFSRFLTPILLPSAVFYYYPSAIWQIFHAFSPKECQRH